MKTDLRVNLILLAAGYSTRMGTGSKKEFQIINDQTVLSQCAVNFAQSIPLSTVIVTCPKDKIQETKDSFFYSQLAKDLYSHIPVSFIPGGSSRQLSVLNGLEKLNRIQPEKSIVLIHDGARPYTSKEVIQNVISGTIKAGAAVPVVACTDTLKSMENDGTIREHLVRSTLGAVQTPQGFEFPAILECHRQLLKDGTELTDDSEVWDAYQNITGSRKCLTVPGHENNIKITYKKDLPQMTESLLRVGIGNDLHLLTDGRPLMLGGIEIPSDRGEVAHSDGDVLLHAITDSLLGAAGMGDIGSYFPPEDPQWKDANSAKLLKTVWDDIKNAGWTLNNLDCIIELEKPKFLPWRQKVIKSIASILEVNDDLVFVKAKTNEKTGPVGEGKAIKAQAVCMLKKQTS